MPPRTPMSSLLGWRCPQCTNRSFTTTSRRQAVGPEHPRYIEVPEPPQQNVSYRPPVKGVLPVPRDVFAGTDKSRSDEEAIAASTKTALKQKVYAKGSREEWKAKMSEVRKKNLREGIMSLRSRQQHESRRVRERSLAKQEEREAALHRPEREDERLTAPSTNLDLEALLGKQVPDPTREQRIAMKRENVARREEAKRAERLDSLHTLYMNARDFIVTPQQLDKAVDEAFGTEQNPVVFGVSQAYSSDPASRSIWAEGRPERVEDMLNKAHGVKARTALESVGGRGDINKDRIRRIAEMFTGGKMDRAESGTGSASTGASGGVRPGRAGASRAGRPTASHWSWNGSRRTAQKRCIVDLLYVGIRQVIGDHAAEHPDALNLLYFIITFTLAWKIWNDNCGGFGIALLCMALESISHVHREYEGLRLIKRKRLLIRIIVAIILICLPLATRLNSVDLVGTVTALIVLLLVTELGATSDAKASLFGREKACRYTGRCSKGQLMEMIKSARGADLADLAPSDKEKYEGQTVQP